MRTEGSATNGKLRCALMANAGYGGLFLSELLRHDLEVVAVFHASDDLRTRFRGIRRRYLSSRRKFRDLIKRFPDKLETLRDEPLPARSFGLDVIDIAKERGIPLFPGIFVHDRRCPDTLRDLEVDLVLVVTFGEFLPEAVINAPRIASVNVHPSLLPAYRGGFPEFATVFAGEPRSGVTAHHVAARFDAGPIILQRECAIDPHETTLSLKTKLAHLACELVPDLLRWVRGGDRAGTPQNEMSASYTRTPPDFDHFDRSWSVERIKRLMNACDDVEEIGRPRFDLDGRRVYAISFGESGLRFQASDGDIWFDAIRYRHRLYRGDDLERLISSWRGSSEAL